MNKKNYILIVTFVLLLSILTAGCGKPVPTGESSAPAADASANAVADKTADTAAAEQPGGKKDFKFAMVFDLGGIGDNGYNMEIYQACVDLSKKYGISFDFVEPKAINDYETQFRMYADSEEYDVIIGVAYAHADALRMVAPDYPDQKFAILDTVLDDLDNVHSLSAFQPEQHFLSGVIAGLVTQDERMPMANPENVLGFAIAMDSPVSRAQAAGFMAGARYVNPEVEFITNYIGSYKDPAKAKEIAMTAYGRGADIVCQNAGASGMGVFAAGEEAGRYVVASSIATITPGYTLTVSLKKMEAFLDYELTSIMNGTWEAGSMQLGIKDGACGYTTKGTGVEIPQDIIDKAEEIKQQFIDGKFTLPNDMDQIDEWTSNNHYEG
ncbi:BMP family ABC transporter substrate-binding protein [Lacrimispora brassicae]